MPIQTQSATESEVISPLGETSYMAQDFYSARIDEPANETRASNIWWTVSDGPPEMVYPDAIDINSSDFLNQSAFEVAVDVNNGMDPQDFCGIPAQLDQSYDMYLHI
jgi:hypothetical protein